MNSRALHESAAARARDEFQALQAIYPDVPLFGEEMLVAELVAEARDELVWLGEDAQTQAPVSQRLDALAAEVRALRRARDAQSTHDPAGLLDVRRAARLLGLSTSTVYKLAESCELPSVRAAGRLRFRAADLDGWVEARVRSREKVRAAAAKAQSTTDRANRLLTFDAPAKAERGTYRR